MAWIVRGAAAYSELRLAEPDTVMRATAAYEQEQDSVAGFLSDCCHLGGGSAVPLLAEKLRSAYERWCRAEGAEPLNSRALGRRLKAGHGIRDQRSNGKRFYLGISLLISDDEERGEEW
jgi:phage/plasmid-associated DNA primase